MSFRNERVRTAIAAEAAEWFVANREREPDAVQRDMFAAWLKTSPLHVEEYLGIGLIAQDLRHAEAYADVSVPAVVARARADSDNVEPFDRHGPTPVVPSVTAHARLPRFAAVGAASAAALAVVVTVLWSRLDQSTAVHYATRHGEMATERLADDSVMHLDTDTSVSVRYDRAQRLVEVERGRAFFEVAHRSGRPFRVLAGFAQALAIGTKFDVYRHPDSTVVTVIEGLVTVALAPGQPGAAAGRTVQVRAGEQLQVSQGSLPARAVPADTRRGTAWLRREIMFEQEPLAVVAAEFNRYSSAPIEIETPELRALQISGVFAADDTESFVAFLRTLDGVTVQVTRERIRVSRM